MVRIRKADGACHIASVGEVYIGVCTQDLAQVQRFQLSGTRDEIQNQAVAIGIEMLKNMLFEKN